MTAINIIGRGFLDMGRVQSLSVKRENQRFRFSDISLDRSTELEVPATWRNRLLLDMADDPVFNGETMRRVYDAEFFYDGGVAAGLLEIRSFGKGAFQCVFRFGTNTGLDALMDLPLGECATTLGGVIWKQTTAITADNADPAYPVSHIMYDDQASGSTQGRWAPSVNVKAFCEDILSGLGCQYDIDIDKNLWMVAATLNYGKVSATRFEHLGTASAVVTQDENLFDVVDITLEWGTHYAFGLITGGGSVAAKGFRALVDVEVTFDASFPSGVYLVNKSDKLNSCVTLGGVDAFGRGDTHTTDGTESRPLAGATVSIKRGQVFFFAPNPFLHIGAEVYYGWKDVKHPFAIASEASPVKGGFEQGDTWMLRNNMPDATVFGFLKSVALATGKELSVTLDGGAPMVTIKDGGYSAGDVERLDRVVSEESLHRRVPCWGDGVKAARMEFDDPLVFNRLVAAYSIDSDQATGEAVFKSMFSDGDAADPTNAEPGAVYVYDGNVIGSMGQVITDGEKAGSPRWTLGIGRVVNTTLLQRISVPDFKGYADIANASTSLRLRRIVTLDDFLSMGFGRVFQYLGALWVWTDAVWNGGIAEMTLQEVSRTNAYVEPPAPDPADVSNYVQDGLVLHLDGILSGDDATEWPSLVGGIVFKKGTGDAIVKNSDNLYFSGNARMYNSSFAAPAYDSATIEIVIDKTSTAGMVFVPIGGAKKIAAGFFSNGLRGSVYSSTKYYQQVNKASISLNADRCLYNGVAKSSSGTDYISSTSTTYNFIGCRYNGSYNNYFTGKIYSIRIYNRKLTEAEQQQNLAVDIARFGIGN